MPLSSGTYLFFNGSVKSATPKKKRPFEDSGTGRSPKQRRNGHPQREKKPVTCSSEGKRPISPFWQPGRRRILWPCHRMQRETSGVLFATGRKGVASRPARGPQKGATYEYAVILGKSGKKKSEGTKPLALGLWEKNPPTGGGRVAGLGPRRNNPREDTNANS